MWTLTRHAAPTSDAEVPDQPALQGVFTDEFTATDYLAEALGSRFQLAPARSLSDELETTPADQWLLAINRALAQHDGAPDVLMKLFKVTQCAAILIQSCNGQLSLQTSPVDGQPTCRVHGLCAQVAQVSAADSRAVV